MGCIGRRDGSTNAFGNKEDAAVRGPVDIAQGFFCLCEGEIKSLPHFDRVSFDIFREGAIGDGLDLVSMFSGKAACVVQEWFVSSISDARKNNCQLRSSFICSSEVTGNFGVQHLLADIFLQVL